MSTPNTQAPGGTSSSSSHAAAVPMGSAGPSTPATAAAGLAHANANASTPRASSGAANSAMHPSPANHRSPTAVRSLGATPMARAVSSNTNGSAPGAIPMQRGHTTGMKGLGTPKAGGGVLGGKTVPGVSSAGLGIGALGSSSPAPNNQSSPAVSMTPGARGSSALAAFDSPAITGSGFGGSAGGVDMGLTLSSLGIAMGTGLSNTGSAIGRMDEDERRRRLEAVLDTLRKRPGRISREAIERLGRRCELDMQMDGEDELSLAGKNAVMLEVQFKPNKSPLVERVSVAFPTASDAMAAHAEKASRILQNDLTPPLGIATINASLDKFSDNLERLARLDKLSIPGANCFEAVFGVYTSLKRLYEHEKKTAEALVTSKPNISKHTVDMEVMCAKSGRPRMHSRRRVGLSLEYWKHRHLVDQGRQSPAKDGGAMDVDNEDSNKKEQEDEDDNEEGREIAAMTIECEPSPPALYPTIRITDAWLSERIEKPLEETQEPSAPDSMAKSEERILEWEDPLPPLIPTVEPDPMSTNAAATPTQPHARFIAKLEPPIALPLQIAAQVYASVDVNIMQESVTPATLDSLILSHAQHQPVVAPGEPRQITSKRSITAIDENGQNSNHDWDLCLFLSRAEPAVRIEQLPFSHPRQIVAVLPILRQYAFITKLLQNTFMNTSASESGDTVKSRNLSKRDTTSSKGNPTEADLLAFLSEPASTPRSLDVAFSTVPSPHLTVNLPSPTGVKKVTFSVLQNGAIVVDEQDVVKQADGKEEGENSLKVEKAKAAMGKALSISEDLGLWAEWVRTKFMDKA